MYQFMMKFCLRTCSVMDSMSQQDHCYLEGDLTVVWGISCTTLFCYVALLSPWERQNLFLKRLPSQILFIKWLPAQTRPLFPSLDQSVLLFPSLAQRGPLFPSLTQRVLLFQSLAQKLYQSMTSAHVYFHSWSQTCVCFSLGTKLRVHSWIRWTAGFCRNESISDPPPAPRLLQSSLLSMRLLPSRLQSMSLIQSLRLFPLQLLLQNLL